MLWLSDFDWALFFSALISSTLFPGGSEALLLYKLSQGENLPFALILIATLGNVIGSCITYGMGWLGIRLNHRWFEIPATKLRKAEAFFTRYGAATLLFAWLPVIGDPLCFIAGALRYHAFSFITLVSLGKLARYTVIALPFI